MKIYLIGQKGIPAYSGGVERHVEELAVRLAQKGHQVFAYTRPHYTPVSKRKYRGINLISIPTIKTKHLDAIVHTFLSTLDVLGRDADIIHFHAIGPASLVWLARLFKPSAKVIFTDHCQDYRHQKWGFFAKAYLKFGEFIGVKFAHQVIAVSKAIKKYLKTKYHRLVIYLPNGAPVVSRVTTTAALKKFGLGKNGYILNVGRLVRHKGVHTLIEAYMKLNTDKKLVIVGDGFYTDNYVSELKALAAGNENIIFTGAQVGKTLSELFTNAYLFVQPSQAEGLSVALLEALAFGKPVLVSDIDENTEVIHGKMFKFRTNSAKDLASKLKFALDNPKIMRDLVPVAKELAKEYEWDAIVSGTEALYRVALAGGDLETAIPTKVLRARA